MKKAYYFDVTFKLTFWVEPFADNTTDLPEAEAVVAAYLQYCQFTLLNGKELSEAGLGLTEARVVAEIVEFGDPEDVEEYAPGVDHG